MFVVRVFLATALAVLAGGVAGAPPAVAAGIPDTAMLQPADLGGAEPRDTDHDDWPKLRPPKPCGLTAPAPLADRAVTAVIGETRPEAIMEYVAEHSADGATGYLRKLRKALKSCPDWRLERSSADRLTFRWTQRWEHVGEQVTHHTYGTVAHTAGMLVLVTDSGWETSSGDPVVTERLITPALRRAATSH
ncbi:hypothetical protein Ait01nite_077130 [Actinoplanes italicus]|uniref:PknH-like protein n=1 Tax=Actinoplanes italicus TaxID=113567 RepID=A0A2T0K4S0_9ACTN|nr:hypothetical protein [Actinoplanes italicus]PRX17649.1 hypothetical protein CLV67_115152 [Actinoplanes italicus]GIE34668.1 hypothetical protein Ait01nite_077130 [Actinoplanes italicus]